jgi:HEAT repeat protein
MGFYDLSKEERQKLIEKMENSIKKDLETDQMENILNYASDGDTYIRKKAYLILGRLYRSHGNLTNKIINVTEKLLNNKDENIRQTAIYAFSEIGKIDSNEVWKYFEIAMRDRHHKVRNATMGSLKQMGQKNPEATLKFSKKFLHDPDPEVRRVIVHGMELRGRTHPQDILPLLEEMQNEKNKRVRDMVIHVIGQISYKKGCLETTVSALKEWKNKELVNDALLEIIDVHSRYKFADKSPDEAKNYINKNIF